MADFEQNRARQNSPYEGKSRNENGDRPQQFMPPQPPPPHFQSQPPPHSGQQLPQNPQHMVPPRPPPMGFPPNGMGPQPFGMGVPVMPPPMMMGIAPMPIPYLTAPVLSIPAPIVVPAPPLKQPLCTEPNNTIRVSNLKEKITIEELKKGILKFFSKYGEILDVVALKGLKLKGQAFVIYKELDSAVKAVAEANGVPIFNRVMVVQFSHNRSDKIAEFTGQLEENKRERHERFLKRMENRQTRAPKPKTRNASGSSHRPIPDHMLLNKILFLQHLPADIDDQTLVLLFKQYPGFKEVRLVPGRSDIAFVEYDTEHQASMAKSTLNNYPVLPDHPMKITFAKR